jgi:hypothetical protein
LVRSVASFNSSFGASLAVRVSFDAAGNTTARLRREGGRARPLPEHDARQPDFD